MATRKKELAETGDGTTDGGWPPTFTLMAPSGVSAIGGDETFQYSVVNGKVTTDNLDHVQLLVAHGFMLVK